MIANGMIDFYFLFSVNKELFRLPKDPLFVLSGSRLFHIAVQLYGPTAVMTKSHVCLSFTFDVLANTYLPFQFFNRTNDLLN